MLRLGLTTRPLFSSLFSLTFSTPKHLPPRLLSIKSSSSRTMSAQTIEHIVLFKVKPETDPTKVNAMVDNLNGLISLDNVLHLTAGPLHRIRSPLSNFTHMLHSRYSSKEDLSAYSANPIHVSVVKESVVPICEDVMSVDWVVDEDTPLAPPPPGSAIRVTFLKLKEKVGDEAKKEILGVIKGIKDSFEGISEISVGENFSPGRAKGFSIASLAVFPGLPEMEAVDAKEELVNSHKEKLKDYLDGVIVVDYVLPSPPSSSL
ncbi:Dabb domain-containing protein [Cephalotus follicularis]|uniref:Dabb domain-containing protein n=1 Tax=Cephalotus follicularis TaxID=3775 RepID=A0A1Q3BXQ2_CEPFO|nr:Dabb domain-containing protein [Cephalotus follicularis]